MGTVSRTVIEVTKEALHFAAAHFTLFSATKRENLHGHNFFVALEIEAEVGEDGLAFDYNIVKTALKALCDGLDERTLLPERSPHLSIERDGGYVVALFNEERIPFLPRDVRTLPVANITVEALAAWFVEQLKADPAIKALDIHRLVAKVSSGPGQWARAEG
ncbi:MAG: 6-pyruvoyl tetrahydropterin synthase [Gammaproteobacteria bacterium]|nr:6-pyruvoyl tetrahydropterin synthase [Gammaproteobacteria bacterium]MYK83773.1 6-pyruvoyl tetrahydropterin synthase [Gammaproteobacteria bacterium]